MTRRDWVDEVIALSTLLQALADRERGDGEVEEYLVLEGLLRDSAFKIRKVAQVLREIPEGS